MQLNIEQRKIITAKPSGHTLVKGVAGSGKTTVAICRIPFLLNHYCVYEDDAILMLTFNKTLSKYIKYQYEKIDDQEKMDFASLMASGKDRVAIETVDRLIFQYFLKYKTKHRMHLNTTTDNQLKYQLIQNGIFELKAAFPDVAILEQKFSAFLLDEINWIKACNYMELEEYQNADRLGRMNKNSADSGPQKLQKNSPTRQAIFELMLLLNKKLADKGLIDLKDASILALQEAKTGVDKTYTHIIIDESQDLTRVQLEFISLLYRQKDYSNLMFVYDTAQSIYGHSWLVKGRSFASIGYDMTGKSASLSKNYRTTTQISQAAYSLIQCDPVIMEDENFVAPSLIDRQGRYPVYRAFPTAKQEAAYVVEEIQNHLLQQYERKEIAVIAKNRNQLAAMKDYFDQQGLTATLFDNKELDFEENSVKLLTIHSIKGLEFKAVFIVGLNEGIIPRLSYQEPEEQQVEITRDRKLLYVGMTRANELLYLTSSGSPSPFIRDIDPKLRTLCARKQARSFYPVPLEDYQFQDKLSNLYANEEKVRQWFLQELIQSYKYPAKLVEVEYPVNAFSRVGAVDIAVCVYGKKAAATPLIFVEVKAYGVDLQNGLAQLKSYMSNEKHCSYGVVTNGREIIVIDSDFAVIDDIPAFDTHMLPNTLESFRYVDLKHGAERRIERDITNKSEVEITDKQERKFYPASETKPLILYGNIAAGQPVHMNDVIEDQFHLPAEWFSATEEFFMLKVRGDSMIDANIDDGDYVVIRKQDSANNRDIVAVSLDDDATLKRFVKMGHTVLLMPENEKYEPIPINSDQARILGVACAVVKREEGGVTSS
ncbi:repressor LexA [Heliobacterium gestii]|uniref:DNA 3'-5' helicase n=1 Tax=Heliomicrobium gestii TaxID=2699 RepID=A0A845LB01_HELGE|nr:transcriptional repressor LexA [Heliomicrobium gestii]MBM7866465.1 SOS regulatory protein LexA [Heliomicrobium gestii]MZP42751.1 repressor LexA [Heliomicrobium gestii]